MTDVARMADVSTSTVSRALSAPGLVSNELRARVSAAAEALSYVPNKMAGSLAAASSRTVGIVVPTLNNSVFAAMLEELTAVLGARGYQTMIGNSGYSLEQEEQLVTSLLAWSPAAVVLTGLHHSRGTLRKLVQSGVPVVEVAEFSERGIDSIVGFSHYEVGRAVARHFIQQDIRRLGLVVVAVQSDHRAAHRGAGFRAAIKEEGGHVAEFLLAERPTPAHGTRAFAHLMERPELPGAIFFSNDMLCLGGLFEAQRRGVSIPSDVRLCGYGDLDFMAASKPSLSSIRPPDRDIGKRTAELLLDRFEGRGVPAALDLGFLHVVRESG